MPSTFVDYGTVSINPILRKFGVSSVFHIYLEFLIDMYYIIVLGKVIRIR